MRRAGPQQAAAAGRAAGAAHPMAGPARGGGGVAGGIVQRRNACTEAKSCARVRLARTLEITRGLTSCVLA